MMSKIYNRSGKGAVCLYVTLTPKSYIERERKSSEKSVFFIKFCYFKIYFTGVKEMVILQTPCTTTKMLLEVS